MGRLWQTLKEAAGRDDVDYPKSNPFKSKAQMRKFFAMERRGEIPKGTAERWARHTKDISALPERKRKK